MRPSKIVKKHEKYVKIRVFGIKIRLFLGFFAVKKLYLGRFWVDFDDFFVFSLLKNILEEFQGVSRPFVKLIWCQMWHYIFFGYFDTIF